MEVPKRRICVTRALKNQKAFRAVTPKSEALFSGTVHFVNLTFETPGGPVKVPLLDLQTALDYAVKAAVPIANYCTQYGTNHLGIDTTLISFTATLTGTFYTDADIQKWVGEIAAANNIPTNDAIIILSPHGVTNTDAPISQGVLGYHGYQSHPYCFANVLGTPLTVPDSADYYAVALSHEIAEMVVDPLADLGNPEVCDPCAGNCGVDYRNYFDASGTWQGGTQGYAFFTDGIVTPAEASACPAPASACIYNPTGPTPPPPPPNPCVAEIGKGVSELLAGNTIRGHSGSVNSKSSPATSRSASWFPALVHSTMSLTSCLLKARLDSLKRESV